MLVLGIDPGTAITGFGLVEENGNKLKAVDYGYIRTTPNQSTPERLKHIYQGLSGIIQSYRPDLVAIEELFFNKNVKTALAVGQARGVAILAGANHGLEIAEYTPLQVKQAVVGYGRASKEQVIYMVQRLLNIQEKINPDDAADALAIAVCGVHAHHLKQKLGL